MAEVKLGPVEIWLFWTRAQMEIGSRYVYQSEATRRGVAESVSMRAAQREVTGDMIAKGWEPVGRWVTEVEENGAAIECYRNFRPGKDAEAV